MRIEIVSRNLKAGGAERVISQLINYWSNHGIECYLVLIEKDEHFYPINDNICVKEIGTKSKNRFINKILCYSEVRRITKKINPSVVLSLPEEIGIYVILSLLFTSIPVVVSERNNPWLMPYKKSTRLLRKLMYPFAKGIIFQTENASKFFSEKIRKKGVVLPNPVDLSRIDFAAKKINSNSYKIISAGRLEKQKNFALLIDAFGIVHKRLPQCTLNIYGEGSERSYLENKVIENGLEGVVFLPGKTDRIIEKMQESRMFVMSSDYEGVPNVLIEAMSVGLPCVSTDCEPGGAASIIDNAENGFLVPIGNAEMLADRIIEVLTCSELEHRFIENGKKVREKYNINSVSPMWLRFLQKCKKQ